jgi:hypothetical protein
MALSPARWALSPRDRRAVLLAGSALILLGLYFLVVEPLAGAYSRLAGERSQLAARVAHVQRDQRKAERFAAQIKEYERTAGELAAPKPYDEQITTIGSQIVAASQMNGVMLRGSTPTAPTAWAEDSALQQATFVVEAQVMWPNPMGPEADQGPTPEAAWESVFNFLGALYRIPGVLSLEQLDLSTDQRAGG